MNILDKTDKSIAPAPGSHNAPTKREKYSWAEPCSPGRFKMISKYDLNVDDIYQRDQKAVTKVLSIARKWDWSLFGTILVSQRRDGSYWVYEGGHRTAASFYRDDIDLLPCMVFSDKDISDEARAFVGANTLKSNVSAIIVNRAGVVSKEPHATMCEEIAKAFGYRIVQSSGAGCFSGVVALRKIVEQDPVLASDCFGACARIANGMYFSAMLLSGLALLVQKMRTKYKITLFETDYFDALLQAGVSGCEAAIHRERYNSGVGGSVSAARGLLEIINKNRRSRKLVW